MLRDAIAVLDFGGQYAHLIATKIRALGVLAEILDPEENIERLREYKGIILSGSPALASQDEEDAYNKKIYDENIPILGFCFGHQEIAKHYGGKVEHRAREYGKAALRVVHGSPIFDGLADEETVWMSHGDSVVEIGNDFTEIGRSVTGGVEHRNAAIASDKLKRYGFQFHPEVDDTINGQKMLYNFAVNICGISPTWEMRSYKDHLISQIKKEAGGKSVFLLASGGVDSTVCAALLIKALGPEKVHLLHIDNGLMRKNESLDVIEQFKKMGLSDNFHFRDASEAFLSALKDAIDPEVKRKIIGETFIKVFEEESKKLSFENVLLAQGTIYPDTIETKGTKKADLIKTHHNRVPLITKMIEEGRVIEPIKELYKVEVRQLGESLGLPHNMVWRHPFPGPGLGVRLLCHRGVEVDVQARETAQKAIGHLLENSGTKAAVMPVKSVGVKGDLRAYDFPVLLWGKIDWENIEALASKIYQIAPQTNRCVVLLSKEEVNEMKPLKAGVTKKRLDLLREADDIVTRTLTDNDLYEVVWQCPTAFVPMSVNGKEGEFVIIRPVYSERAMTAQPALLNEKVRQSLAEQISKLEGITGVALDITTKPPGTIEWE
jgi:GMP synthase (glutamine-hydrolysing)